jgi:hypothetical protein
VLFISWGASFVEHLREWFVRPFPQTPPLSVWFAQFLHMLDLVGLVAGFFWEFAGGTLVIVASVLFFWDKAPIYIPLTILPGILYLICWYRDRAAQPPHSASDG